MDIDNLVNSFGKSFSLKTEYEKLVESYNTNVNSFTEKSNFLKETKERYCLYLQEIDDWLEIEYIRDNIIHYISTINSGCYELNQLYDLSKDIDGEIICYLENN